MMTEPLRAVPPPELEQLPSVPVEEEVSAPVPHLMAREYRASYMLLPQVLDRIAKFEEYIGNVHRAESLALKFEKEFCSDDPRMGCGVFVGAGGEITAHGLASIETVLGEPYLYVAQLWKTPGSGGDLLDLVKMAIVWGQARGIERVLAYPAGKAQGRLFRRYGFKEIAATMALDLRSALFVKE